MKKRLMLLAASAVLTAALVAGSASAATLKMKVKGAAVDFQYGTPFIENGSSLMPLRDLLIALGVPNDDEHIIWNGSEKSVTIKLDDFTVKLAVGDKNIYVNGELFKELEVPAQQVVSQDSRVFLPARAVAEALGNTVGYDAATGTVVVEEQGVVETKDGVRVNVPPMETEANQVYGLVTKADKATGKLTVALEDGSTQDIEIADDATIAFPGDYTVDGAYYKTAFHDGITALITLNDDGTAGHVSVGVPYAEVTVKKLVTEEQSATAPDGSTYTYPVHYLTIETAEGQTLTLSSSALIDTDSIKEGSKVWVDGVFIDGYSFESVTLAE
ncbi:copper amine oxidase N-terminal domain-containing protein [Paenibacillus athensensis]|nr:copper amine oxidase N-terminal domain-containing protein [Paenibacillus athensensis]MCD1258624.1 copper amine oxidase N-terminal domain-containing protein [Paenibacillus athensensis]